MFILFSLWQCSKFAFTWKKIKMVHSGVKMGTRESKMGVWALLPILDSLLHIYNPSWTILKIFSLKDKFFSLAKEKIKRTKYYFFFEKYKWNYIWQNLKELNVNNYHSKKSRQSFLSFLRLLWMRTQLHTFKTFHHV